MTSPKDRPDETCPDYILRVTHEIWEERQVHTLRQTYSDDVIVRTPASVIVGNEPVIAATLATLAEFPDRQLLGQDVIWCDDADGTGWMSSHRILSTATHASGGAYGPGTGKPLQYHVIGDCAVRDGVIYDEWLIRDQGSIVRQLGLDPQAYARDLIAREGGPEVCVAPLTMENQTPGRYPGHAAPGEPGERYAAMLRDMMSGAISRIASDYDRAVECWLPGGTIGHGIGAAERFWMGLRAAFPSAEFQVEHVIGRVDPGDRPRAACRWTLKGRHDGWGAFGTPTSADVYLLGISHAEFGPRGLAREFVLIDETAIWKQIALQTGQV